MNALTIERTPAIVATEINSIKEQTRNIVLCNSIEIGRRLVEAKAMLEHGEWGKWLKESVDYSPSTANNLMRIFEEYGANQQGLFGASAKSQTLGNLTYSQAVALLGIPGEEREAFAEENDVENMSTRELKKVIKERDRAIKEKETAEKEQEKLRKQLMSMEVLQKELEAKFLQAQSDAADFEEALNKAKSQGADSERIKELEAHLTAAREEVKCLAAELEKPVTVETTVVEKVPPEIEKELIQLREKAQTGGDADIAVLKYRMHFETLTKCFGNLLAALGEMQSGEYEKYTAATKKLLTAMEEKI